MMEITSIQGIAYWSCMSMLVFVVGICIIDENALPWLTLQWKILLLAVRKQWLLLKMKPDMWLMKRRMKKVLRDLEKQNATINSSTDVR